MIILKVFYCLYITKINKINMGDKTLSHIYLIPFIIYIRQVGVYTPKGVAPSARHLSHIVHTKIVILNDTTKQIPIYNSYKVMNIHCWKHYRGGPSVWHTTPPLNNGGPLPRIPPLTDTMSGVKKGVNPLNLAILFLNKKWPLYPVKIFLGKKLLILKYPLYVKINFWEKFW